jgi:hypothetical protein
MIHNAKALYHSKRLLQNDRFLNKALEINVGENPSVGVKNGQS